MEEQTRCIVSLQVSSLDVQPKADPDGQSRVLALEAVLEAKVLCHRNETIPLVSDCYSTQYESSCQQRPSHWGAWPKRWTKAMFTRSRWTCQTGPSGFWICGAVSKGRNSPPKRAKPRRWDGCSSACFAPWRTAGWSTSTKPSPSPMKSTSTASSPWSFGEFPPSWMWVSPPRGADGRRSAVKSASPGQSTAPEPEAVLTSLTVDEEHPKEKDPSVSPDHLLCRRRGKPVGGRQAVQHLYGEDLVDNGLTGTVIGEKRSRSSP